MIFDNRRCVLGEGPLWHPLRKQLFWFDIIGKRLLTRERDKPLEWSFKDHVSAAGWVDSSNLLIASDKGLFLFDINSGNSQPVVPLEADNRVTRSNDGRADPWGGFWIGTMGCNSEPGAGAIYRYYKGEMRTLYDAITVPNAICFSPDHQYGYYTDTPTRIIHRQKLDQQNGWPVGEPEVFVDLNKGSWNPDGAVVDAQGRLWNAQWEGHRVAVYSKDGKFEKEIDFPALKTTCPAFGGDDLTTLFCTSAGEGLDGPEQGLTYAIDSATKGQTEYQIRL